MVKKRHQIARENYATFFGFIFGLSCFGKRDSLLHGELSGAATEGAVGTSGCGFGFASGGAIGYAEAGSHPFAGAR